MKILKRILVVILVIIVAIFGFMICASIKERSEIKKVVEGYYDAWGKCEYSRALIYCDINSSRYEMAEMWANYFEQSEEESDTPIEILEMQKKSIIKRFEETNIECFGVKIDGNKATAYVRMKGYEVIFGGQGAFRGLTSETERTSNVKEYYVDGRREVWDIGAWQKMYDEADKADIEAIKSSVPEEHEINLVKVNGEWKVTD